jgi:hypothetical protein
MTDIKRIGDAGIHTVEGNVAGSRAARLTKQRDLQKAEYEAVKNKIKEENTLDIAHIDNKFNVATDTLEQEFRKKTVGLVTADEFRKARELINVTTKDNTKLLQEEVEFQKNKMKKLERENKRKRIASTMSFEVDGDDDGNDDNNKNSQKNENNNEEKEFKIIKKKNPTVDTSFLPDRERDKQVAEEREKLKNEWLAQQEIIKREVFF